MAPATKSTGTSTPNNPVQTLPFSSVITASTNSSAIVRLIERNAANASLEIQLESFVRELKHGFGE